MRRIIPLLALSLLACGSRSGLLSLDPIDAPPPPAPVPADARPPEPDASVPLPIPPPPELEPAVEVSAGLFHTCAATRRGRAHCWGFNNQGQIGDGTSTRRTEPVASPGVADAVAITAGQAHSCALRGDGTVLCWGNDLAGQLGGGGFETRQLLPVPVDGLVDVVALSAGGHHTCALIDDGRVFCWGDNDRGQVGPASQGSYRRPVSVPTPEPATSIAAGFAHTCALLESGRVICWGEAATEVRVRPDEIAPPFVQTEVPGLPAVTQLTSGDFHSCAVAVDGRVFCWGFARTSMPVRDRVAPSTAEAVPGLTDAVQASAGHEFTCALRADGGVRCWGNNERGQLGDQGVDRAPGALVAPIGLPPSTMVTCGWRHGCALDTSGVVRCWGRDWEGQLGDGLGGEDRPPVVAGVFRE